MRKVRLFLSICGTLACLAAAAQQSTPKTYAFNPQWFDEPSYCEGGGCAGSSCPKPLTFNLGTFNDPLPPGSKLRSVSFTWTTGSDKTLSFQVVPNVTIFLDGTALASQDITNVAVCSPGTAMPYTWTSQDYPNGFPSYAYKTTTSGGPNVMSISIADPSSGPMLGDEMRVSLTYEIPPPFDFSVTDAAPVTDRRILISNLHPGYPYPQFQSLGGKDGEVPLSVQARGQSGQYESGLTVYLRVADPEDTAPYMNLATNKLAHTNDNVGPLPILDGTGIAPDLNAGGVYQATSGANGVINFILKLQPGTASGDNYQIEASFDETFPPDASWKSGTMTAWKRIFVEKHKMLRNGIALSANAASGDSTIHVVDNHYGGNQGRHRISRGDRIVLVHGAAVDHRNALEGWYLEEHIVADVTRGSSDYVVTLGIKSGKDISPETLQRPFGPDPSQIGSVFAADSIANLSTAILSSSDYFDAPDDLVTGTGSPFPDAFTEYYVLPDGPFGFVPMPDVGTSDEPTLQTLGEKWCLTGAGTTAAPNHQLLLVADSDRAATLSGTGLTISHVPGETSSWIWRGIIEDEVGRQGTNPGGDPNIWAAKTAAHELSHEFKPNTVFNSGDHCPSATVTYNDSKLYCLLSSLDAGNLVQAQRTNGIARFHLLQIGGIWHSEYLEIRKYQDPFLP
jgi:hypothetical protein